MLSINIAIIGYVIICSKLKPSYEVDFENDSTAKTENRKGGGRILWVSRKNMMCVMIRILF